MAEMTGKERILRAIRGQETDRVPWSPFLAYYWENLPADIQRRGQVPYLLEMGADPMIRGFANCYHAELKNCNYYEKQSGAKKYNIYETKVGTLTEEYSYSPSADSWFLTGHSVKTEEDFKILQYLTENTEVSLEWEEVRRDHELLGENGVYFPHIGIYGKTGFQSMLERWCGTIELVYALYDYPETVEECLAVIQEKDMETVRISAECPVPGFISFEDTSTTNINPAFFEKYIAPEINEMGKIFHSYDKLLIHHACGYVKDLLPLMAKTEIDMVESLSPPPTGNIEIQDAVKLLPEHIGIIGGIEPTFIESCSLEMLEKRVRELLDVMKGKRFVLANSDSCPPGVAYEKFLLVSRLVKEMSQGD